MKFLFLIAVLALSPLFYAQSGDTLPGFRKKLSGEEITYFSPRRQFASTALLTRCQPFEKVSWEADAYKGKQAFVTYRLLIGHSTGTSSADRQFQLTINQEVSLTITTPKAASGNYQLEGNNRSVSYRFVQEAYDVNKDAFGILYLTIPRELVQEKAVFSLNGVDQGSRDWMMVFMYDFSLKTEIKSVNLISRQEHKRKLAVHCDNPSKAGLAIHFWSKHFTADRLLNKGYNNLEIMAYDEHFTGPDSVRIIIGKDTSWQVVTVNPIKNYTFEIVHHSHNDIGYSHLQTEVERIQNNNIRAAINWAVGEQSSTKPVWHIESLWAVENFLRIANPDEKEQFKKAVQDGRIVLTANYANILTGLCRDNELDWMVDYAQQLEPEYGNIDVAMITDIPGITASGLRAYVRNGIHYLSLGPNYVAAFPDRGDRVGGVINEQGDKAFYWKSTPDANDSLLVWTAGKGYSFFHGINEADKQDKWEERLSGYLEELYTSDYPYETVQLRYTKNADNGPVDTNLCRFVENWNNKYAAPRLEIASLPELFKQFEERYGATLPVLTGEISPYWEDGAFSTALEESTTRILSQKTAAMEAYAKEKGLYTKHRQSFYELTRNLVLFHEHTWGAWCSTSDPDIAFTTEQWTIKKAFADSAVVQYGRLSAALKFRYQPVIPTLENSYEIAQFAINEQTGGLESFICGKTVFESPENFSFFEPLYLLGINPIEEHKPTVTSVDVITDNRKLTVAEVKIQLEGCTDFRIQYTLDKRKKLLKVHYELNKIAERRKESLHIAFPLDVDQTEISYPSGETTITVPKNQLPGSNYEFICTENTIWLENERYKIQLHSPSFNLVEIGAPVNENTVNGVKQWRKNPVSDTNLFLYVLNNYWHTNYKADQSGPLSFDIYMQVGESTKK